MEQSYGRPADLAAGTDPGIPTLHTVLSPVMMAEHLRRLFPHHCDSVREVQTEILKRHRTRCTFEIRWRAEGGATRALIGKVWGTDRADIFRAMVAVRRAGFGPDVAFSIPEPVAYVPELNLLLLEKVAGPRVKEVLLTAAQPERVKTAEQCARWLARFHAAGPRVGEPCRVDDVLDEVNEWSQSFDAAGGVLANYARQLHKRLEAAAAALERSEMCAGHGHFTSGQVLVTAGHPVAVDSAVAFGLTGISTLAEDRTVAFDWDDINVADPSRDVASFVVHLRRLALQYPASRAALRDASDVFLRTYLGRRRRSVRRNLPFYAAARCLRLASRDVEKEAIEQAAAMLAEGLSILDRGLSQWSEGWGHYVSSVAAPPLAHATDVTSTRTRTILLYAQDNRGLGHINRTLIIARHILAAYPTFVVYIATKSSLAGGFKVPERCDYIKLPTRLTAATIRQTKDEEEAASRQFRALRSRILHDAAEGLTPDFVLVDHEPLGSAGEFRDGLYTLKAQHPATRFVFGMRDITDDPDRIRARWQELGAYEAFENLYDGIAVYGSRRLYDVAEAYAIPTSVRHKLHYCGYIVRDRPPTDRDVLRRKLGLPQNGRLVLATVGSGIDGYPVLATAREAVALLKTKFTDLWLVLVTGPFMAANERALLEGRATATCHVLREADTFELMTAADAVVSMGGYNSVCEALAAGRPLVIVPRATEKVEQRIRAEVLATHGLARWVHPRELRGEHLADALEWALCCDGPTHAQRVHDIIPAFDGATRLIAYLSQWLD